MPKSKEPPTGNPNMGAPRANTTRDPDANYAIVNTGDDRILISFTRNTPEEALAYFQDWVRPMGGPRGYQLVPLENAIPGSTLDIQRRRQQAAQDIEDLASAYSQGMAGGEFTGRWLVRDPNTGQNLTALIGLGNVQADANRVAAAWVARNRPDLAGSDIEVVPEMR